DDIDLGVLVPLPQDAACSLGRLRRPPGAIDVVERYRATLDVRAGSHSFAGPDQYVDAAVSGLLEECSLLLRVAGLMDEADAVGVYPVPLHERFLELVVGVPLVLLRGAPVAEHDLERTWLRGLLIHRAIERGEAVAVPRGSFS